MSALRRSLTLLLAATAMETVVPSIATGQGRMARACEADIVGRTDSLTVDVTWRSRLPRAAYGGMTDRIGRDQWLELADSLVLDFEQEPIAMPLGVRQSFARHVRLMRDEIAFVQRQPNGDVLRRTARVVRQDRFRIERSTSASSPERYYLFRGTPDSIVVDSAADSTVRDAVRDTLGARALCWRALAVRRMLTAYGALARDSAVKALRDAARNWDNYGERGYSQFPWELAINSKRFDASAINPPRSQFIVVHPALSLELTAENAKLDHLTQSGTVTLEPLGFVYYSPSFVNYFGASALVSLPSDQRVGAGVLLHLGTYGKIGYTFWRAKGEDGARNRAVVISADLYQFLASMPEAIQRGKQQALRQLRQRHAGAP